MDNHLPMASRGNSTEAPFHDTNSHQRSQTPSPDPHQPSSTASDHLKSPPSPSEVPKHHLPTAPWPPSWDACESDDFTEFSCQRSDTCKKPPQPRLNGNRPMGSLFSAFSRPPSPPKPCPRAGNWAEVFNAPEKPVSPLIRTRFSLTPPETSPRKKRKTTNTTSKSTSPQPRTSASPNILKPRKIYAPSHSRPPSPSIREICETRRIRGLLNNGNTCFINSILQSMISCELFRKRVMQTTKRDGILMQKFSFLAWEMSGYEKSQYTTSSFNQGEPFMPNWFFNIFPSSGDFRRSSGTQEDAEEFLSFLLNKLQEEELFRGCIKIASQKTHRSRHTGSDTSRIQVQKSFRTSVAKIFRGSLLNEVRRPSQPPSVTEESFFSLSLNVDAESTSCIDYSLRSYFETELLNIDNPQTGIPQVIEKQTFLKNTPQVLILHLKRFSFNLRTGTPTKILKPVRFPEVLHIPDSIRKYCKGEEEAGPKRYELSAVVTHVGVSMARGHYVSDVRLRKADGGTSWVLCNDSTLREVRLQQVLRRPAYILFYTAT